MGIFALGLFLCAASVLADQVRYLYDNLNRLAAIVQSDGSTAVYNYDAVGNLISITDKVPGDVTIVGFLPSGGPVGTTVTITGIGFSETPTDNQVTFGGGAPAVVQSSTLTSITTSVPDGAITGPITVTTTTGSDTSNESFTVLPFITSISPTFGQQGSIISNFRITGTNLSGATAIEFTPGDGITVANPPVVEPDGRSATVSVTIDGLAPIEVHTVTVTNPDGTSPSELNAETHFTVLPNEPIIADSEAIGIYVQSLEDGIPPSLTVGLFVSPMPSAAGADKQIGVFVEPGPDQVIAPYVGVEVSP